MTAQRSEKEATNLLSTFLLQGWVMTDEICSIDNCSIPLMRSKDASLSFCTLHDALPTSGANHNYKKQEVVIKKEPVVKPVVNTENVIDDGQDELRLRRERREQSSRASQLIGQKMLQRWALLNEHCPNESCYAIPLVRNPDTKQMYCVICENYILTEEEALELEKKKAKDQQQQQSNSLPQPQLMSAPSIPQPAPKVQQSKPQQPKPIIQEKEERKRQKTKQHKKVHTSDMMTTLYTKMDDLEHRVANCDDPTELIKLFKAIKECAGAINACTKIDKQL